jgi:hypothetical protein
MQLLSRSQRLCGNACQSYCPGDLSPSQILVLLARLASAEKMPKVLLAIENALSINREPVSGLSHIQVIITMMGAPHPRVLMLHAAVAMQIIRADSAYGCMALVLVHYRQRTKVQQPACIGEWAGP